MDTTKIFIWMVGRIQRGLVCDQSRRLHSQELAITSHFHFPTAVILGAGYTPKLISFGSPENVCEYTAPEVAPLRARGNFSDLSLSPKMDVYGSGMVLYKLASSDKSPSLVEDSWDYDATFSPLQEAYATHPQGPALVELCQGTLERDPAMRWTAQRAKEHIDSIVAELGGSDVLKTHVVAQLRNEKYYFHDTV